MMASVPAMPALPTPSASYMAWKHRRLLHLDGLGGVYSLALAGALARHLHHPATIVLLAMMLLKALPHMPLLLGFRQQHIR
jgi:hypothetical protein